MKSDCINSSTHYPNSVASIERFGNEFIHRLTTDGNPVVLRVELEDFDGVMAYAEYETFRYSIDLDLGQIFEQCQIISITFRVEDEDNFYRLWVGGYSGNATDSLSTHNSYLFSTVDKNNDDAPKCCPCAPAYGGGWWFYR